MESNAASQQTEKADIEKLTLIVDEAIWSIAKANGLAEEITDIFKERRAATLDDIVVRLHEKSKVDRANLLSF